MAIINVYCEHCNDLLADDNSSTGVEMLEEVGGVSIIINLFVFYVFPLAVNAVPLVFAVNHSAVSCILILTLT